MTDTAEWNPGARVIMGGTFDDPNWVEPQAHFFTRSALHWVVIPVDVEVFETLPSQTREE